MHIILDWMLLFFFFKVKLFCRWKHKIMTSFLRSLWARCAVKTRSRMRRRRRISGWVWDEHVNMIYSLKESLTTQHLLLSQQEIIDLKVRSNSIATPFFFCSRFFFILFRGCFFFLKSRQIQSCKRFRRKSTKKFHKRETKDCFH